MNTLSRARAAALGLVLILAALALTEGRATAAGAFTGPTSPTTLPVTSAGNPESISLSGTGFPQQLVYLEICDGASPSAPAYNPNVHCDPGAGGGYTLSGGPSSTVSFPASNPNLAIQPFRGIGPGKLFNCLAPEDVKPGSAPKSDGSVVPVGDRTRNGQPIETDLPSWTNCQFRLSTSNEAVTADQAYLAFAIPNSGGRQASSVTVASPPKSVTAHAATAVSAMVNGGAGAPTGTVSFNDLVDNQVYTLPECASVVVKDGTASCTTKYLLPGKNVLTADYGGDNTYSSSASAPVTFSASATASGEKGSGANNSGRSASGKQSSGKSTTAKSAGGRPSATGKNGSPGGGGTSAAVVAGSVCGGVVVLAAALIAIFMLRRRRRRTAAVDR